MTNTKSRWWGPEPWQNVPDWLQRSAAAADTVVTPALDCLRDEIDAYAHEAFDWTYSKDLRQKKNRVVHVHYHGIPKRRR